MSGCLRLAPEDKETHAFFFFLFIIYLIFFFFFFFLLLFLFGECFLEVLKGQGRTLSPEAGNLRFSGHSNPLGSREHRGPLQR